MACMDMPSSGLCNALGFVKIGRVKIIVGATLHVVHCFSCNNPVHSKQGSSRLIIIYQQEDSFQGFDLVSNN